MRRKLSLITMLAAWLLATGSHWDLVQTFAWGRMIATYSKSMTVSQAVKLTFTADNLCGICETVRDIDLDHRDAALPADGKSFGKILLVYQPEPAFFAALPQTGKLSANDFAPEQRDRHPPPVPPPRVLV